MQVAQQADGALDLEGAEGGIPAEHGREDAGEFFEQRQAELAAEGHARAPEDQVGQVHHRFRGREELDLPAGVIGVMLERGVRFGGEEVDDLTGPGAIAGQELLGPRRTDLVAVRGDPDPVGGIRRREVATAADGEADRRDRARQTEQGQDVAAQVLGKGAERGPLAADQAEQGARPGAERTGLDAVVAGDEPRRLVIVPRQRTHTGEPEDDL